MLSVKFQQLICKIALAAIVFASFAPSISHALNAMSGRNFTQDVCTSDGRKVSIQVMTTQGRQLVTEFNIKPSKSDHQELVHHLEHCPFCSHSVSDVAIVPSHAIIVSILTAVAQRQAVIEQPLYSVFTSLPPHSHAPPLFA
ncbi:MULTISPECIES: DUF2946 domain-containing protein [unclassified Methylotenera]|jgi:hypothetical protein|uniref:DUF2946 domain-containing protein n=1 Tax=unclassified Methylotenera TaxID=2643294 RepID=UPI00037903B4|nr:MULTISPECIES: DUF2946 domain-containing protein [unclassified Methylotenera]